MRHIVNLQRHLAGALIACIFLQYGTTAIAQQQRASISGIIVNSDGAPLYGASIKLVKTGAETARTVLNTKPDNDGRFNLPGLERGEYILTINHPTFGPEYGRTVSIVGDANVDLGWIELGRACAHDVSDRSAIVTETDKAVITNGALEEAISRLNLRKAKTAGVILSTNNIKSEWLSLPATIKLDIRSQDYIQVRADTAGDFQYLTVSQFDVVGSCVAVALDYTWAKGKNSAIGVYLDAAGIKLEFRKKEGKWTSRFVLEWVS